MALETRTCAGTRWTSSTCRSLPTLSGALVRAYKPSPAVYELAITSLDLDPSRTLMVAAHAWDLRAAASHGLRTALHRPPGSRSSPRRRPLPSHAEDLGAAREPDALDPIDRSATPVGRGPGGRDAGVMHPTSSRRRYGLPALVILLALAVVIVLQLTSGPAREQSRAAAPAPAASPDGLRGCRGQGAALGRADPHRAGLGSGIVFDNAGHVVTNAHVVADFKRFRVTLADGSEHAATLRGTFKQGDLAVVRLRARGPVPPSSPIRRRSVSASTRSRSATRSGCNRA